MVRVRSHLRKTKKSGLRPVREHWRRNRYVYGRNAVKSVLRKQDDIVSNELKHISDEIEEDSGLIFSLNPENITEIDEDWAEDNLDDDKLKEIFNDFYQFCEENGITLYDSPLSDWVNIDNILRDLSEGASYEDVLSDYSSDLSEWADSEKEVFDDEHDVGSIYKIANNNDAKNLLVVVRVFPCWASGQISQIHACNDYDEAEMLQDKIAREEGDFDVYSGNLSFRIVKNTDDVVEDLVNEYRNDLINLYDNNHSPLTISTYDHT